mmetsp:Transcript_38742/g.99075  ORF Transcript_38742/g.99075 Transcript_38742/m.99075 type:complete len:114 (+) Transcript_38742:254-595(+)
MPVICIGPVCVPLNMFLPFLLGVLHSYGWFEWIKKEWVTFRFWRRKITRWWNGPEVQPPGGDATPVAPVGDANGTVETQVVSSGTLEKDNTNLRHRAAAAEAAKEPGAAEQVE